MRYVRDAPVAERSGRPKLRSNEPQRGRKRPRVMKFTLSQGRTKPKSFGCSVREHGRSWCSMNMGGKLLNPDYRDMVECLLREGVDFMLVGGYAVALHGWPRATFDIDFWIMANPENAKAVMRAIKAFGAPLQGLTEDDFHRPGMVFQIGVEPQRIDIISAVDGLDYADASSRAVKMNVDGLEIKVLSLDDLIINKRSSGRPKDVADALTLEKLREKKKNG